jgi:hypothetical protein
MENRASQKRHERIPSHMKTPTKPLPTIQAILDEHVTLTVEYLDRLYLNGYVLGLQTEAGLVGFLTRHLQFPVASTALLGQLTQGYVRRVENNIQRPQLPVGPFNRFRSSRPVQLSRFEI